MFGKTIVAIIDGNDKIIHNREDMIVSNCIENNFFHLIKMLETHQKVET